MQELLIDVQDFETRIALLDTPAGEDVSTARTELLELHVERANAASLIGNLYWARVRRIVPGIQAAFVDIGLARPGFLHQRDMPAGRSSPDRAALDIGQMLHEQQQLLVQVTKDPLNGKGVRLSTHIRLAGTHVVLLPGERHVGISQRIEDPHERERLTAVLESIRTELGQTERGCIARTAAQGVHAEQIRVDFEGLLLRWQRIMARCGAAPLAPALIFEELPMCVRMMRDLASAGPGRRGIGAVVVNHDATFERLQRYVADHLPALRGLVRRHVSDAPLFAAAGVEQAICRALDRRVPLPGGGHLVLEHTEAMTTIDVNSGTRLAAANLVETALQTNLQAASAIPRELRLRNVGGIVVVDFIDMEDAGHQERVMAALRTAARDDPARFQAGGFSPLGLVEISRRRTRETLRRQLCGACPHCAGQGYVKSPQTVCYDIFRALQWQARLGQQVRLEQQAPVSPATEQVVRAAQSVVDRLRDEEAEQLAAIERAAGQRIRLQVDARLRVDEFKVDSH